MKTWVEIDSVALPVGRRAALASIYPEGMSDRGAFRARLQEDDVRIQRILNWLHGEGFTRWRQSGDLQYGREYSFILIRQYESQDLSSADCLEFWPEVVDSVSAEGRDAEGRLRLERPTLKEAKRAGLDFAHATMDEILVVEPVRDRLLEGSFRHLVFRPTVLVTGRGTRPGRYTPIPWEQFKVTRPWWELTSDIKMPPLAPSADLRDPNGEHPFRPRDAQMPCRLREGFYNHAELRYRRSDLSAMEPFDVALTFENFGFSHTERRSTVVSKRFYQFCADHGLKGRWAPVRIEEG